jgi:magnesium-protoporphyrin O-methyltransferase
MPCNCCEITDSVFSKEEARSEIKNYRRKGPAKTTRLILDSLRSLDLKGADLLDIGGGIGVIHHELLKDTARSATHVDASSAYLKEAKEETARRGHGDRVNFIHADFTDVANEIPSVDIVTLDRVVCCYPHFRALLHAAAEHSREALALSYPREVWYMRIFLIVANLFQKLRRDPFRVFLHPIDEMDSMIRREGFERIRVRKLFGWEVALYQRLGA